MSAIFIVNGSNVTVQYTYTGNLTKLQNIVVDVAHAIWDLKYPDDPDGFDALNNQQKLDLTDVYVKRAVISLAEGYTNAEYADTAIEDAAQAAATYIAGNYELN